MPHPTPSARPIAGVLPVFQTPFYDDESIDFDTLAAQIDWLFARGADGVAMGMVSETLRLSAEERDAVAAAVCRAAAGRGPVLIAVGAESTHAAERHARHAEASGAAAVMAAPPVATRAGGDELLGYYRRLFRAVAVPVVVQDASGYVGQAMAAGFQARLLDEFGPERAYFKPEAAPVGPVVSALRESTGGRARVFEGSGGAALPDTFRRGGVVGTIPGGDQVDAVVALWKALSSGDFARADRIGPLLTDLVSLQVGLDGYVAVEKHLLRRQGVFKNEVVRGPVGFVLDAETRREVDRRFDRLQREVLGEVE